MIRKLTLFPGWASECPNVKNYKWWLNPVWHIVFYSYTHMATVGVKGLKTGKSLTMLKKNGNLKSMLFITGIQSYKQESPAIADKPARRESLPKLLQFDVPTTLSLTILAYLNAFNCYCVRNPRNPEKFTGNSNLWNSRSSKVIDLGANRKPICDFILVMNSNFSRICYRSRDIHG